MSGEPLAIMLESWPETVWFGVTVKPVGVSVAAFACCAVAFVAV